MQWNLAYVEIKISWCWLRCFFLGTGTFEHVSYIGYVISNFENEIPAEAITFSADANLGLLQKKLNASTAWIAVSGS